jgi:hypothetical protein
MDTDFLAKFVRGGRELTKLGVLLATATTLTLTPAAVAGADELTPATFSYTGAEQTYTVPAGVTSVNVVATGAAGGAGVSISGAGAGGAGADGAQASGDLPVVPGEKLYAEVGGSGGVGSFFEPGSAGYNGGAIGGGEMFGIGNDGGGGGGASDVRSCSISSECPGSGTLESRLIVAAGGSGGGGGGEYNGGNGGGAAASGITGSPGAGGTNSGGGGGGAGVGSGGAAGSPGSGCGNTAAGSGTLGAGGVGGLSITGGGGGGGGYYGGGGGGGGCGNGFRGGGGGGGGSSYGPSGTSFSVDTSGSASVTITPILGPAVQVNSSSLSFPSQAQTTVSAPQTVTITNTGGSPLKVSGVAFEGADAEDFLLSSSTCDSAVAVNASCALSVRFVPQGEGAREATLLIESNDAASPAKVTLSGTGGHLPQGPPGTNGAQGSPGTNGSNGAVGTAGVAGATGAQGPAGPQGLRGPAGKVELVTCKTVTKKRKHKQLCTTKPISGTAKFTVSSTATRAMVSRGGLVYATGALVATNRGGPSLELNDVRPLSAGRYTLTLQIRHGLRWRVSWTEITID